jgi:LemA protein
MELVFWILVAFAAAVLIWVIVAYNALVAGKSQIANAWAQIGVQLKRRHDLVPNLVESAKGYMQREQETLARVIEARARAVVVETPPATIAAENLLSGALGRLIAVMESYPQLKADQGIAQLMEELTSTENRIACARQHYNDSVMDQRNRIESFPSNMVATRFGFRPSENFDLPEAARQAPKVALR